MPIDFPSSPTTGQVYTYEGKSWVYNGTGWDVPRADIIEFLPSLVGGNTFEGVQTFSTPIAVPSGGTGAATLTSGGYLKGAGASAITSQSGIPAGDITSGTLDALRIPGIETFSNTVSFVNTTATTYNAGTFYPGPTVSVDATTTASFLVQFTLQYGANAQWQRLSSFFTLVLIGWKATGVAGVQTTTLQHHNGDDLVLSYRTTVGESGNRTFGWSPSANLTVGAGANGVQILMKRIF